jgi:demethylmenaquinone methyltransferase/2-methoxy-6-polyprenyl-1,4-benzoquinol methylase
MSLTDISNLYKMVESGWFYGSFIDPVLKKMRKRIATEIQSGEKVIDVACGTGAQVLEFTGKASVVVGVDLSDSMIAKANQTISKNGISNAKFYVENAIELSRFEHNQFDVATMSLALHQFEPELHSKILAEMKRISRKIIIVDYAVPLPKNYAGTGSKIAEFFAGREHHSNFKQYYKLGGLNKILPANKLQINRSVLFGKNAFQMAIAFTDN